MHGATPQRSRLRLAALAALLLAVPQDGKGGCLPRRLADLPVRVDQGLPIVSVMIGGHRSKLILDTGAEQTLIATPAAYSLGVQVHQEYPKTMRGLSGNFPIGKADVTISAGDTVLTRRGVSVGPISLPPLGYITPDGLLGADILSEFEVDLDLPHELLHLYAPPPSCVIAGPLWPRPYDVIAANRSLHDRLFFPLALDGSKLTGIFDSGSDRSVLDKISAQKIGTSQVTNDQVPGIRGVTTGEVSTSAYRFRRLVLGTEEISNPLFVTAMLNLDDAGVIIGMDYLRWHRVWLSYGAHKIFVQRPTGGPNK